MKSNSEIIQVRKVFTDKIVRVSSLLRRFDYYKIVKWSFSKIKRFYPLIISFFIILIGSHFIYNVYNYQTDSNFIIIYPGSATKGVIFGNETYSDFNPSISKIPIFHIDIRIKYKIPVERGDSFEIEKIRTSLFKDNYNNIDNIKLKLTGAEKSVVYSEKQYGIFPYIYLFDKDQTKYYDIYDENYGQFTGNAVNLKTISTVYENEENSLIFSQPKSNDNFDFSYELSFDEADEKIQISGEAELLNPIRCANDIEMLSMQTNKNILLMTGALIILGSFPFVLALTQLLQNSKTYFNDKGEEIERK